MPLKKQKVKDVYLQIPDALVPLINRIELNCSLLQFKHKASFMVMDNAIYPPATSEIFLM